MFNDEVMNAIPFMGQPLETRTHIINSGIYTNLRNKNFQRLDGWVKDIPETRSLWLFPLCEGNHWMAMKMDKDANLAECYDPMKGSILYRAALQVSNQSIGTSYSILMLWQARQRMGATSLQRSEVEICTGEGSNAEAWRRQELRSLLFLRSSEVVSGERG